MADQESLHDSLTDTHRHAQSSCNDVEMPMESAQTSEHVSHPVQDVQDTAVPSIFGPAEPAETATAPAPAPFAAPASAPAPAPPPAEYIEQRTAFSSTASGTSVDANFPSVESAIPTPQAQPLFSSVWASEGLGALPPLDSTVLAPSNSHPQEETPLSRAGAFEGTAPITAAETTDAFAQAEYGVEVGSLESEQDDGYETDNSAASMSLASSAREFIYENGRRYHSFRAGAYSFPNDDREQDREDLKHAMFLKLFNKTLHFAPISTTGNINVIDLGTGTGIWSIDFADSFPDASVLGIDLSPIQTNWVPPNLKFMVDDAESEWVQPPDHFDYIHTRHTIQAFHDWPQLYERAFTHLKPGAWIESQEIDHFPRCEDTSMAPDDPMVKYWDYVADGLATTGVNFRLAPQLASYMRAAGFVDVTERIFFTPIGPWPRNRVMKEAGLYWRAVLMEGLEAIALGPFTRGLGWRKEEVEVFLASVRKAYLDKNTHAYMPFHVVYGMKPFGA